LTDELQNAGWSASAAQNEASRRLGSSRILVKKTVREYQRRYWCARWPLFTFLLGPIPLLFLGWIAISLLIWIIFWPLAQLGVNLNGPTDGVVTARDYLGLYLIQGIYLFAIPAAVVLILARWAKRAAMRPVWICTSALIVAMFMGMWICGFKDDRIRIAGQAADQPLMGLGFNMFESWHAAWKWYTHDILHTCQLLVPLGIAMFVVLRTRQLSRRAAQLLRAAC
jgi:hypothetical protein